MTHAPAVALHTANIRAPVSEFIYGQFIEHLGRCIYGGIWAEMLEDRKFYLAIGDPESPWTPIASPTALMMVKVNMVKENAFVGEHSPEITLPGADYVGISHGGLALIERKEYVGRVILSGDGTVGPVEVRLIWGDQPSQRDTVRIEKLRNEYQKYPLRFRVGTLTAQAPSTTSTLPADIAEGRLEIVAYGRGRFRIGAVSLMPADNVHGMRADTLRVLRELDAPIYRWPGGNFVSGYNWKDGIGDPDQRPPRKNPAWQGVEHNDFGIDEFMTFCRELMTEPYIVVNSGQGDATLAAEEVEYVNGAPQTPMGRLRATHGHRKPYAVKWWGIGNEMYGDWQLGYMPLEEYVKKHNQFAQAMRAVDPGVKLIAVGATGPWTEKMLADCADHMDLLSEHFYCGDLPDLDAHVRQIGDRIRAKCEAHRRYLSTIPALSGKTIPIAIDEWNYWHGPDVHGELGIEYSLKDALGVAIGIHEFARNSDLVFMANYAQTVNVLGCIKANKTTAAFDTTGLVLELYRHHFGRTPIEITGGSEPLDVAAAWSDDRRWLTVAIVNPTLESQTLALEIEDTKPTGEGRVYLLTGPDPLARNALGEEPKVTIKPRTLRDPIDRVELPPLSVSLYVLHVERRI
ncbi:MAG: alpha-N-arabinofuranosidase [Candidatus Hydrogenedentes bacterium]|nr:alpha-N-arabinofuranosidase [Candidatus Hydrogenedentota bacterium]